MDLRSTEVGADLTEAKAHYDEHGYVILPAYLSPEDLGPARATMGALFPTREQFHADPSPDVYELSYRFPYKVVEWSLLTVSAPLVRLGEALLGTRDLRVNEAHNWAKFTGARDYEQELHRDYGNHTLVAPTADPAFGEVEMFIWIDDVPDDAGPTHIVSRTVTAHLPPGLPGLRRHNAPEIYAAEVSAAGPAGTVLAYRNDTFHRGTAMTGPEGARYALKVSFMARHVHWTDRLGLMQTCGSPEWIDFVNRATPRMLELFGFPPPGDRYWTADTFAGTCARYPDADLSAFSPA
jgi:hypothetical protein